MRKVIALSVLCILSIAVFGVPYTPVVAQDKQTLNPGKSSPAS